MSDNIDLYRGDDFDAWVAERDKDADKNKPCRPALQYQTPLHPLRPGHLGGWVLQKPNPKPPFNFVAVPLQARNEDQARAEAAQILDG